MNSQQIIEVLDRLGIDGESVDEQLYSSGSYGYSSLSNEQLEKEIGRFRKIPDSEYIREKVDWGREPNQVVLHCIDHNVYLRSIEVDGSYGVRSWSGWIEVFPKEIKTIFFEDRTNNDSSLNSY